MKKNNTAEKTVQDAKNITKALKESTMKSLKDLMNEAIEKVIKEDDEEEEPEEIVDNSYEEVKDVETDKKDDMTDEDPEDDKTEGGEQAEAQDAEDTDEEWSDMEEFKVGDSDYDFTGTDGETALKVFNKLGDDDQIIVKKEDDNTYTVKDEETGGEYTIELDSDITADDADEDVDISFDDEDGDEDAEEDEEYFVLDPDDDGADELDEDKNFVVNDYQKKDPIEGLKMTEPADKKQTYSMDAGVPTGTERPYGNGAGNGQPFDKKVNEGKKCPDCSKEVCECGKMNECGAIDAEQPLEEGGNANGMAEKHSAAKTVNHIDREAKQQRNVSTDGEYQAIREAAIKIYNKAKQIQNENKQYKQCIKEIKNSLKEAAVLNVTLAQVVKLLSENTTTENEKKSIVNRFSNVKTIKEGKELYNTIKNELNEAKKSGIVLEGVMTATPNRKAINETTIYSSSTRNNNPALDLMNRMDNLYKK